MKWLRRRTAAPEVSESSSTRRPAPEPPRENGPWDATERECGPDYIDLGSLRVRGRDGLGLQLPTQNGQDNAVLLVDGDSALEVRVFAASKGGGEWAALEDELVEEIQRQKGAHEKAEGPFGPEFLVRFPAQDPEGNPAIRPARIIGVEGPRWLLRATILGRQGQEVSTEGSLWQSLLDLVVVRGKEPRMVREPLPLKLPEGVEPQ